MDKPLIPDYLMDYIEGLVPPRPKEMMSMEASAAETDFPIVGPSCGYLCYQIARMIGAKRIFELGSGYGYSTAWFAQAVKENGGGEVYHVVWDETLSREARKHLAALGYEGLIHYQVGEAVEALKHSTGPFDLIFNDINKEAYSESLPVIASKLRPGGVLIVDNMLWHGHIFESSDKTPATESVRKLTRMLVEDPGWIVSLIPLRDGLFIAYKK